VVAAAIGGAWLLLLGAQLTGIAGLLHHHALIEHGPAIWVGMLVFLAAWLVMVAAMMLPASLPAMVSFVAAATSRTRTTGALVRFLGPYALIWTAFGLAAFIGDLALHHAVHAMPWLAARPWLLDGSVLGLAGLYQLLPLKRRSLDSCRHPAAALAPAGSDVRDPDTLRPEFDHAIACLGSSWALMLMMFAEGFGGVWWMLGLTGLMAYEVIGRHGELAARLAGIALVVLGLGVMLTTRSV
jgi:predicted metal-binding membrane protein